METSISPLSWGSAGAPILPTSLRCRWASDPLPTWVSRDVGLADGSSVRTLVQAIIPAAGIAERVKNYFAFLLSSRIESVRLAAVVDRAWPPYLSVDDVPWRRRTKNCLLRRRLADRLSDLPRITFADLFDIPGMGALSVLDFACTLEAVLDSMGTQQTHLTIDDKPARLSALLTAVLDDPWSACVSERDPRFAAILPAGPGILADRIDGVMSNPETSIVELEDLANSVVSIRARIRELERLPLEDSLGEYVSALSGVRDKRLPAILARLHLDGAATGKTQDEAGALAGGITRQRIQQLEARTTRRRPEHTVVMPALDRAIATLLRASPVEVHAAAQLLQREGISRKPFHPKSVFAAATYTGRVSALEVRRVYDAELVVALGTEGEIADRVIKVARRQASQAGASSVSQVSDVLTRNGIDCPEPRVAELIRLYSGAEFLGTEWFCFPLSPNDSVRTVSRKMLSVTTPLSVSSMRDGIKRAFRFKRSSTPGGAALPAVPPREVLASYYRAHPDFAISDDGSVRSVAPLDYRVELGPIEQVMVSVLRTAPTRVLDRPGLSEACEARGVNLNSLWTLATYSAVMEHLGVGLWTLRGTVVDPAALEAYRRANAMRPREQRVIDHGWASNGELWIATRLPAHVESFVFGVPGAIGRFLAGKTFAASDRDGAPCGILRVYENLLTGGSAPFLRRAGADEGDIMLARFDIAGGTVSLSLIDDDALEELSPEV